MRIESTLIALILFPSLGIADSWVPHLKNVSGHLNSRPLLDSPFQGFTLNARRPDGSEEWFYRDALGEAGSRGEHSLRLKITRHRNQLSVRLLDDGIVLEPTDFEGRFPLEYSVQGKARTDAKRGRRPLFVSLSRRVNEDGLGVKTLITAERLPSEKEGVSRVKLTQMSDMANKVVLILEKAGESSLYFPTRVLEVSGSGFGFEPTLSDAARQHPFPAEAMDSALRP